jgi:hypothetical protein
MPTTQPNEGKSRQRLAAENMTRAQRLHRAILSGALKSELRTAQDAIHAARALALQISAEGFALNDNFFVHIAYLTPDLSMLFTRRYVKDKEAEIYAELAGPGSCSIMAGLFFGIIDPERNGEWVVGARQFLNTPLVTTAFKHLAENKEAIGVN